MILHCLLSTFPIAPQENNALQVNNPHILDHTRDKLEQKKGLVDKLFQKGKLKDLLMKVWDIPNITFHLEVAVVYTYDQECKCNLHRNCGVLGKRTYHWTPPPTKGVKGHK